MSAIEPIDEFHTTVPWWPLPDWISKVHDFHNSMVLFVFGKGTIFIRPAWPGADIYWVFDADVAGPGPEFVCEGALALQCVLLDYEGRART